jgi:hypothetical protein
VTLFAARKRVRGLLAKVRRHRLAFELLAAVLAGNSSVADRHAMDYADLLALTAPSREFQIHLILALCS